MPVCLIGLGSNQGDRRAILTEAVSRLAGHPQIELLGCSAWNETVAVGGRRNQPSFLNGAVVLRTSLAPQSLLTCLQQIEKGLGRRRAERWGPRTIDLDLLLYDELALDSAELTLPHPRMAWRRFVLEPAAEVAGEMIHPTTRWSVARLLDHINAAPPYVAVAGGIAAGKSRLAERLAAALPARLIEETPDWNRMKSFYANPAGLAWEIERQLLDQRVAMLSAEKNASPTAWAVSDFWFDQSLAFARAWLPSDRLGEYVERFDRLRPTVLRPRLLVLLDVPADVMLERVRSRGRRCEQRLTVEQLDRIRRETLAQAGGPDQGPVLHLWGDDIESNFTEALAAVESTV